MQSRISPKRDNPVSVDWSDVPVCQHGNPVPGYCASCELVYEDEPETIPCRYCGNESESGVCDDCGKKWANG